MENNNDGVNSIPNRFSEHNGGTPTGSINAQPQPLTGEVNPTEEFKGRLRTRRNALLEELAAIQNQLHELGDTHEQPVDYTPSGKIRIRSHTRRRKVATDSSNGQQATNGESTQTGSEST